MGDGIRGDHTKTGLIVGIAVAALIAATFIGWGLWQAAEYEREANNYTREYAAYTDKKIGQACVSLPPIDKQYCTAQARQEQRDNERNERELEAQRQSALWAYIMGAAAVIGMGLSVIGVFLVWTTFAETRKANGIANDALDGQLRPWISFELQLSKIKAKGVDLQTRVAFEINNHGPSPALFTTYTCLLYVEQVDSERIFNGLPVLFEDELLDHGCTVFPGKPWDPVCVAVALNAPLGEHPITLVAAVQYRSAYSDKLRYTCHIFDYVSLRREDGLIEISGKLDDPFLSGDFVLRSESGELAT